MSIFGGAGDDVIATSGKDVTITGGKGNDAIFLVDDSQNNLIQYTASEGNDTIWGLGESSSLSIVGAKYNSVYSGDDIFVKVGAGSITLKNARNEPAHVIIGESSTEGGGSNSGNNSGGSSSGTSGGGGGNGGGNVSGGTSSNEGRGSDASGGRSAVGSSGSQTSSGINGGERVSSNRKNASTSAATRNLYNEMTATNQTTNQLLTPTSSLLTEYAGGNQVISNYQSGEKIIFCAQYTGAFYDGAGNFFAGSSTGALVVQNAMDKVIDLSDAAGNDFVKAYAATAAVNYGAARTL